MKRLLIVIVAAAALWSGYWFVGASGARTAFDRWFQARQAEGWQAEYADFALRGYPNRFDATWRDLQLADPGSGLALDLPLFQILALSYRPNHVIAVWPHDMLIATPTDKVSLQSERLRASLRLKAGTALELERAVLDGDALRLTGDTSGALQDLHLAAQRTGETSYRLGAEATDLTPPAPMLRNLVGTDALPEVMQLARLDAEVTFDKPWDRTALGSARPQPRHIDLSNLKAIWGVMEFQATGALDIDGSGRASGKLDVQAVNWREMLAIAAKSGAIPEGAAQAAETMLGMGANASGNPNSLDIALTLKDGKMFLGFVPLGPAPIFRLR